MPNRRLLSQNTKRYKEQQPYGFGDLIDKVKEIAKVISPSRQEAAPPVELPTMPNTPIKGTYDQRNTMYAVGLINNFLYKLVNSSYDMTALDFDGSTTKYYTYSKGDNAIGFSQVSKDKQTMVVCFRGTQTLSDFFADIQYNYYAPSAGVATPNQQNPDPVSRTAPGFTKAYNKIKESLLANVPPTVSRIFICGHSLGGSLALLAASDLSVLYKDIVEVYAIAPPRTGNPAFANLIKKNSSYALSLINLADTVPAIIFSYMFNTTIEPYIPCAFSHVDTIAVFNNLKGDVLDCHRISTYYEAVSSGKIQVV